MTLHIRIVVLLSLCAIAFCSYAKEGSMQHDEKVIVVGAGISGLIAALHLEKAGIDVIVLDKESQVGGRVYSEPLGGVPVNLGAQYFFKSDNDYLNHYVRKAKKFFPNNGKYGALWNGHFVSAKDERFFMDLPIDSQALYDFGRSIKEMQKDVKGFMPGREYVFDKQPLSQAWSDLDEISAGQYLSKFHPDVANLFDMLLIPEGGAGVDETSALLLTGWYGQKGSDTAYLIEGGNQLLAQAMANDLTKSGGALRLSTEVTEITNAADGVIVQCIDGTVYEADYVIVTAPASVARRVVKGLSRDKQEALEAVSYGASMQVGLHLKDIPVGQMIASSTFHNEKINAYMDQSKKRLKNEAVISLNIAGAEAHTLSDEQIIQRVSETLQKIYPDFSPEENIVGYSIKKWEDGIVRYPPGFLNKYQEAIRAPFGRIFFGGDYTHSPALDGAAWSGVRAADQVLAEIDASKR